MASFQNVVTVTISLDTAPISRASFGVPIFIGNGQWFRERVRSYLSITEAAADLPATSDEFKAVQSAFTQQPKVQTVKVGRRDASLVTLTPSAATAIGQVFSVTVEGTDGVAIQASFTSTTGAEAATAIVTALVAGLAGVVGVTVVNTMAGAFTLAKATGAPYAITAITDKYITAVSTATEAASATLVAVEAVDNDFYFVAAQDKTEAYVIAMADAIEAREKVYFVSVANVESLAAYTGTAATNDVLGKLFAGAYLRTVGWFHQDATTKFPEMAYIAVGATFDPGKVVWANNVASGQAVAQDPATGLKLSTTQKGNLTARNASFTELTAGVIVTSSQSGKVASGEWVDIVRNRDFLVARITEAYQNFFISQPVVPYTDSGINRTKGVLSSELSRYVETETEPNILELANPYTLSFPSAAQVTVADKTNRTYSATFSAFLSGAIQITNISGSLSFNLG